MSLTQKPNYENNDKPKKKGLRVKLKSGEHFVTESGETIHNDSTQTIYIRITRKNVQ